VGLAGLLVRLGQLALLLLVSRRLRAAIVNENVDVSFFVLLEAVVVVAWFGKLGDDIPRVNEAGDLKGGL
jgi:hypothetical protein